MSDLHTKTVKLKSIHLLEILRRFHDRQTAIESGQAELTMAHQDLGSVLAHVAYLQNENRALKEDIFDLTLKVVEYETCGCGECDHCEHEAKIEQMEGQV